jgi:hypothetical protein
MYSAQADAAAIRSSWKKAAHVVDQVHQPDLHAGAHHADGAHELADACADPRARRVTPDAISAYAVAGRPRAGQGESTRLRLGTRSAGGR